jgi:hypothetical protein
MINIFFVPGMFGSTIEFCLRGFTKEYIPSNAYIANDGSMHTFNKEFHVGKKVHLSYNLDSLTDHSITTPIYPFTDLHLSEILEQFPANWDNDKCIIMYADTFESAEMNILFQFYKIAQGSIYKKNGLDIFCGKNQHNITTWNSDYTHWSQMKTWEIREWFSIFYVQWIKEWQDSADIVNNTWLKLTPSQMLTDTENTICKIIDFCGLSIKPGLNDFCQQWRQAQQYIIDEYQLLDNIVTSTVNQRPFSWAPISIVSEAIVQQRFRQQGYELRCDGLDIFPTNSIELYNLLDNSLKLHHQQD